MTFTYVTSMTHYTSTINYLKYGIEGVKYGVVSCQAKCDTFSKGPSTWWGGGVQNVFSRTDPLFTNK